jgi:uncharacterized protein
MTAAEILAQHDHRPFPLSKSPWVMRQEWHDLLFAHWPISPEVLRPLVPKELPLDLWQGTAYVGVVPFVIRNLRPRGVSSLPILSHFAEINVRTYVTVDGKPGVYFFSLDAENLSAVLGARLMYGLPYYKANFRISAENGCITYESRRTMRPRPADFHASYHPASEPLAWCPPDQTLDRFLTERYCLYAVIAGHVYRTNIHHLPWPLQLAKAEIGMTDPLGLPFISPTPLLHYSKFLDVLVWWPEKVS